MSDPRDAVPERFRRFLPEGSPAPTPAEAFEAHYADGAVDREIEAKRWRVRSRSAPGEGTRVGFAAALGILLLVLAALGWRVLA